ncbi:MAG TPA: nucleotidyltransferase domain-containing protein [Spirochaetota bacterium]|nr:nucleotidyltransferase domain-containing protein [Spirochaetota bacterium]
MNNTEILTDLKKKLIKRFGTDVQDVILYGSQLSGSNSESDYDILILLKSKPDWQIEREISDICYEIDLEYGIITDVHILGSDELDSPRGRQPVFVNAISGGLHV